MMVVYTIKECNNIFFKIHLINVLEKKIKEQIKKIISTLKSENKKYFKTYFLFGMEVILKWME